MLFPLLGMTVVDPCGFPRQSTAPLIVSPRSAKIALANAFTAFLNASEDKRNNIFAIISLSL
jgi:hypothetical protein